MCWFRLSSACLWRAMTHSAVSGTSVDLEELPSLGIVVVLSVFIGVKVVGGQACWVLRWGNILRKQRP